MSTVEAHEPGLVNEVVPRDRPDEARYLWVQDVLARAPLSVLAIKEAAAPSATVPRISLTVAPVDVSRWEDLAELFDPALPGPGAGVRIGG